MTEYPSPHITELVDRLEARIRDGSAEGVLAPDTVEALDVVNHGLSFTRHPRGLALWRQALWQRQLSADARQAVIEMLEYLESAGARGETRAAAEICDCLTAFLAPEARLAMEHNHTCIPAPTPVAQALLDQRGTTIDLAWLELERGMYVLDLGCGTGGITRQIARAITPGRVLGLDASPQQLSFAAKQAVAEGLSNLDLVAGDANNPQLPSDMFDCVVSHSLLMYLCNPIQALARQRELVRPGGLVAALSEPDWGTFAHFPHSDALDSAVTLLIAQIRRVGGDPEIGRKIPSYFHAAGLGDVDTTEAPTGEGVISGKELSQGPWLMTMRGVLEQGAQAGLIGSREVEEVLTGVCRWTDQPGSFVIWPRAIRAKARR
jgi:SAM-dependent methyltransferase